MLRRGRVEMGAHQCRAVGVGGAEGEIHPRRDILGLPVLPPVAVDRIERPCEGSVRVRLPWPDVSLVEMGVHVDEGWPDHAPVEIELG